MTDQELANDVRAKLQALRKAVEDARAAGLVVSVPTLAGHWLDTGTAPGEPSRWSFTRTSF